HAAPFRRGRRRKKALKALVVTMYAEELRSSGGDSTIFKRYGERAREAYTVFLKPFSSRGAWDGAERFQPEDGEGQTVPEPIGFLTRATVRPRGARGFWGQSPGVSKSIGENPDVLFKAGMGEVPGLQQVTFSIWPNLKSMSRFAYRSAEHAGAIRAVREGDWFREELYARFEVLGTDGQWMGGDPVAAHLVKAAEARAVARAEEVQGA
ncbi:MAG: hypothetical protein ACPGID_04640, partial [Rubricella sp.]